MSRIWRSILYKERVRDKTVKGARDARGQCRRGFARSSLSTRVIFITLISPLIIVVQRAVTLELEQQSPLYHRRRKRGKRRHEGRGERGRALNRCAPFPRLSRALLGAPRNFSWRCARKKGTAPRSGLNLSRCSEEERRGMRARETRCEKRDRKRQTGRRSKPTHLECKSAGKKNKLGGSNNKEICFSSNTRAHAQRAAHMYARLGPLSSASSASPPPSWSFFKRTYTRTSALPHAYGDTGRTFESYLALTARFKGPPCYLTS